MIGAQGTLGQAWPASGVGARPAPPRRHEAAPMRALATGWFVFDAVRRRRAGRMAIWTLVLALGLSGLGMLVYPFATDLWAGRVQNSLERQFTGLTPQKAEQLYDAFKSENVKATGKAVTRMRIPRLGVNVIVVEGVSPQALRAGVGHYPKTALPGEPGNMSVAGHRTGYRGYFRHIDKLRAGDRVELTTPFGVTYVYEVVPPFDGHANPWITHKKDWTVIAQTPEPSLTLTSCDPPYVAINRLIVRARLVGSRQARA